MHFLHIMGVFASLFLIGYFTNSRIIEGTDINVLSSPSSPSSSLSGSSSSSSSSSSSLSSPSSSSSSWWSFFGSSFLASTKKDNDHAHREVYYYEQQPGHEKQEQDNSLLEVEMHAKKYYSEPWGTYALGHYDKRFFRRELSYEEHAPALRNLVRSYLTICRELDVETWLAHGSLLGWYWNGRVLPWDIDIDAQVTLATLHHMARHLNGTMHEYVYDDPKGKGKDGNVEEGTECEEDIVGDEEGDDEDDDKGRTGTELTGKYGPSNQGEPLPNNYNDKDNDQQPLTIHRRPNRKARAPVGRYLLDVNPHYSGPYGNGENIIDARWIDTATGLFVDITGVAPRRHADDYDPENPPGPVWSCKYGLHRYYGRELWPLRVTEFEGVSALIPYGFSDVLREEYGPECLSSTVHAEHEWDEFRMVWVKTEGPPVPKAKVVIVAVEQIADEGEETGTHQTGDKKLDDL